MTTPRRHRLRLLETTALSPSVRHLVFASEGEAPRFRPGQSMNLVVPSPSGLMMRRPYSVASAPNGGRVEFAVTRVKGGVTSTALHTLEPGALIDADGPNRGWLGRRDDERDARMLLVATGSGLAPFRAILQHELANDAGPPISLLFGCRTQADILWRHELSRWAALSRFSLTVTLSRPDGDWIGPSGWVQRHVDAFVRKAQPDIVLLCGLSRMTEDVERQLVAAGVPSTAIRSESFDMG